MQIRIYRSPEGNYYDSDILNCLNVYTDEYLTELTSNGFNGIWLRAILRDVSANSVFPEFGQNSDAHSMILKALTERAKKHNVKVYLYLNEPLFLPAENPFWEKHPDIKGAEWDLAIVHKEKAYSFCISHPDTVTFMQDSVKNILESAPLLGGFIMITRSEDFNNCYSHANKSNCPRCSKHALSDIISKVINTVEDAVAETGLPAKTIAWNWSWPVPQDEEIISKLNKKVILMAGFERGAFKTIAGKKRLLDEYSLSYVGPSEKCRRLHQIAKNKGIEFFAKLQIGTTHEIATVRNLPLITNILQKVRWLKENQINGSLACWCMGNCLSFNTFAFNFFLDSDLENLTNQQVLENLVHSYFKNADSAKLIKAWEIFAKAFDYYPFCQSFLYLGPTNYALSFPLPTQNMLKTPLAKAWKPLTEPYGTNLQEAVDGWEDGGMTSELKDAQFTLEEVVNCTTNLAEIFAKGINFYEDAFKDSTDKNSLNELKNAQILKHCLISTSHLFQAFQLTEAENFDQNSWDKIANTELKNLNNVLPLLDGEKTIGYHNEAQSWYFNTDMVQKKINLILQNQQ